MKSLVFKTSFFIITSLTISTIISGYINHEKQFALIKELKKNQKDYILFQLNRTQNNSIKKEYEILKEFALSATSSFADALYNIDEDIAQNSIKSFLKKENIIAVEIYDNVSKSDFKAGYKKAGKNYISNQLPREFLKKQFIKYDLYGDGRNIGYLKIFYDNDKIYKRIRYLKEHDLQLFNRQSSQIDLKIKKYLREQIIDFVINGVVIIFIIVVLLGKLISKPLLNFQNGLQSFFEYLKDPKKKVVPIAIDTEDEFGQMAKSVNENIKVSMKLHGEISNLVSIVDKYVIMSEADNEGIITKASEAFCKISGYTKEELIGKPHNIVRHPDMPKDLFQELWEAIKAGSVWSGEIKNRRKDGKYYWVSAIITPKCTDIGASCGYTSIMYDITDKKRVEDLTRNLEIKVVERTQDLEEAKKEIEEIHSHTKDSIKYASLIQNALIPDNKLFKNFFNDYFVIWSPKDIVGGDIYLFEGLRKQDECLLMVIDCTGHGVHGAFVTMLVKAIERQIIAKINYSKEVVSPANFLSIFNRNMKTLLKQNSSDSVSNAGFDGGILYYNKREKIVKFAGAQTPLFYTKNGKLHIIKGDKYSVGYKKCDIDYKYTEHIVNVEDGMKFYLTTDGYFDQNGGKKGFPFGKKRFCKLVNKYSDKSMMEQQEHFLHEMIEWKDVIINYERNDDITLVGLEI